MSKPEEVAHTPGQIAYEAFMQQHWSNSGNWAVGINDRQKAAWEACAKAVLDAAGGMVDLDGLIDP